MPTPTIHSDPPRFAAPDLTRGAPARGAPARADVQEPGDALAPHVEHRPRSAAQVRSAVMDRLPELLGGAGALLVLAAVAGFVVSSWEVLGNVGQAALLAAGSVGLSVQAQWASRRASRTLGRLVTLSWGAAAGLTLVAAQLLLDVALPGAARLAILGAGIASLAHAGWAWSRHTDSILLQLTSVAAAVYAVGPLGATMDAGWDAVSWSTWITSPVTALLGGTPPASEAGFVLVAVGHALVAVTWILVGLRLQRPAAARTARIGGPMLLGWAVLEFNAMAAPIGAAIALLIVIGFLIVGLALQDGMLVTLGVLAGVVTGLRTIWSLFTGETAVTLTIAVAGTTMLVAAIRLARRADAVPARDGGHGRPDDSTGPT